jgi:hypothetical protein
LQLLSTYSYQSAQCSLRPKTPPTFGTSVLGKSPCLRPHFSRTFDSQIPALTLFENLQLLGLCKENSKLQHGNFQPARFSYGRVESSRLENSLSEMQKFDIWKHSSTFYCQFRLLWLKLCSFIPAKINKNAQFHHLKVWK